MNYRNHQWYQAKQIVPLKGTLKFSEMKRDVPYQMAMPAGEISPEGQKAILELIFVPEAFEWVWLKTHKTASDPYIGTLPKRIANYHYKECQRKIDRRTMEHIGNIARAHTTTNTSVIFDITSSLDWEPGDFCDDGSCYWGDYGNARLALTDANGFALRLFTDTGKPCDCGDKRCTRDVPKLVGRARCWGVLHDTNLVLFNAYGEQLYPMARILSLAAGLSYKKVGIANSNKVLYLNGDCVAVGKAESLDNLSCVELDIGNKYANDTYCCNNCDGRIPEGDAFMGADDNIYCETCYRDLHTMCQHCTSYFRNDNLSEVLGDEYWCNGCVERNCYTCENCGGIVPPKLQGNNDGLCNECYESRPDDEPET